MLRSACALATPFLGFDQVVKDLSGVMAPVDAMYRPPSRDVPSDSSSNCVDMCSRKDRWTSTALHCFLPGRSRLILFLISTNRDS